LLTRFIEKAATGSVSQAIKRQYIIKRIFIGILSASFFLSVCATDKSTASGEAKEQEKTVSNGRDCGGIGSRLDGCF